MGSAAAAFSVTFLLGRLTALSGLIGLFFVGYVVFLVLYAVLVSLTEEGIAVRDSVMTVFLSSAAVIAFGALGLVIVYTILTGMAGAAPPQLLPRGHVEGGTAGPLDRRRGGPRSRRDTVADRDRPGAGRPAGHRLRRLPRPDPEPVRQLRPHDRQCHDGVPLDSGRALRLRLLDPDVGIPVLRSGRRSGPQHHDAAVHHPDVGPRSPPGPGGTARIVRRPGCTPLAHHVARGASHRPLGPGHRSHPRDRPRHRRGLPGAPDGRVHDLHERQPPARADGLPAPGGPGIGPVGNPRLRRSRLRHRRPSPGGHPRPLRHRPGDRRLRPRSPEPSTKTPG